MVKLNAHSLRLDWRMALRYLDRGRYAFAFLNETSLGGDLLDIGEKIAPSDTASTMTFFCGFVKIE